MVTDHRNVLRELLDDHRTARDLVLRGVNLRSACLERLRADGLDLEEADLRESALAQVNWKGCILRDARLESADFREAVLRMCDLDHARATNANFAGARLENSTARGARFDGADFTSAVLTDTDLSRASLRGAMLEGVSASGVDLHGADLRGACLRKAMLADADLRGADLTGADLQGADLRGADVRGVVGARAALPKDAMEPTAELPVALQALSDTMTPIVIEVLRTAGERGTIDAETAERLVEDAARHRAASPENAPSPDTLAAVSRVLNGLGDDVLPALVSALRQPNQSDPPAAVKEMILRLRQELSLGDTATAEDVLERLRNS